MGERERGKSIHTERAIFFMLQRFLAVGIFTCWKIEFLHVGKWLCHVNFVMGGIDSAQTLGVFSLICCGYVINLFQKVVRGTVITEMMKVGLPLKSVVE